MHPEKELSNLKYIWKSRRDKKFNKSRVLTENHEIYTFFNIFICYLDYGAVCLVLPNCAEYLIKIR